MLNTRNLKVGEIVIVQENDCYYLAEIQSINNSNIMVLNSTGDVPELVKIKNVHKILNNFAFNIERKVN